MESYLCGWHCISTGQRSSRYAGVGYRLGEGILTVRTGRQPELEHFSFKESTGRTWYNIQLTPQRVRETHKERNRLDPKVHTGRDLLLPPSIPSSLPPSFFTLPTPLSSTCFLSYLFLSLENSRNLGHPEWVEQKANDD